MEMEEREKEREKEKKEETFGSEKAVGRERERERLFWVGEIESNLRIFSLCLFINPLIEIQLPNSQSPIFPSQNP